MWVSRGSPGNTFLSSGRFLEIGSQFKGCPSGKRGQFGRPFWHQNRSKSEKTRKNKCPESNLEKVSYQTSPKGSQGEFCMVITICFEGSTRVHFFDLGWLWGIILSCVGDLRANFCDLFEVRKTIDILRWILEAKGETYSLLLDLAGVCAALKE